MYVYSRAHERTRSEAQPPGDVIWCLSARAERNPFTCCSHGGGGGGGGVGGGGSSSLFLYPLERYGKRK